MCIRDRAWNFGPLEQKGITTGEVVEKLVEQWGSGSWVHVDPELPKVETNLLRLSWEKAATRLDWHPVYTWEDALAEIVAFFKVYENGGDISATLHKHIEAYVAHATSQNLQWAD